MLLVKNKRTVEVFRDLFIDLAAGFFGSVVIFPGVFGIKTINDIVGLLLINVICGIFSLLIALKLKEYEYD